MIFVFVVVVISPRCTATHRLHECASSNLCLLFISWHLFISQWIYQLNHKNMFATATCYYMHITAKWRILCSTLQFKLRLKFPKRTIKKNTSDSMWFTQWKKEKHFWNWNVFFMIANFFFSFFQNTWKRKTQQLHCDIYFTVSVLKEVSFSFVWLCVCVCGMEYFVQAFMTSNSFG